MKKKLKFNENIKCDVSTCKYYNCEEGTCCLKTVTISCSCDNEKCDCVEQTICRDFHKK